MLLRAFWLPLGLAFLVAGLFAGSGPVSGLGVFLLLAGGAARAWASRSLVAVTFERELLERRAFPGERVRVRYRITNGKLLPVPLLSVRDQLPAPLSPPELELPPAGISSATTYSRITHAGSYERLSWTVQLAATARGFYRLGPARLRAGDAFGLFSNEREIAETDGVAVLPRTHTLEELGLPSARPGGEHRGRQRIFEDPLWIAGVRDYQQGDPIRRIDWKATARRGQLQSRVYEPSTTHHLIVALNIDTLDHSWQGHVPELLEANVAVAASLARWANDRRYAVGLLANGSFSESDRPIRIAPGRSREQLGRILEALSGVVPLTLATLAEVVEEESHKLPLGATLAFVASHMPDALAATIRRLDSAGHAVSVVSTSRRGWPTLPDRVVVHRVDPALLAGRMASAGASE